MPAQGLGAAKVPWAMVPCALAFAREHELHTDYVDNCWALVALDAKMLRKFLDTGCNRDSDVPGILDRVNDDYWYLINEEEF